MKLFRNNSKNWREDCRGQHFCKGNSPEAFWGSYRFSWDDILPHVSQVFEAFLSPFLVHLPSCFLKNKLAESGSLPRFAASWKQNHSPCSSPQLKAISSSVSMTIKTVNFFYHPSPPEYQIVTQLLPHHHQNAHILLYANVSNPFQEHSVSNTKRGWFPYVKWKYLLIFIFSADLLNSELLSLSCKTLCLKVQTLKPYSLSLKYPCSTTYYLCNFKLC